MFFGEARHTIDTKGRLILPAKYREELGLDFVLTKGLDQCIFIFPAEEWVVLEEKLKALPLTNKNARAFIRYFFSGAAEGEIDKQGRIRLPQNLLAHAGLEKDAIIMGVGTRLEIWDPDKLDEYYTEDTLSYDRIAENMGELGI